MTAPRNHFDPVNPDPPLLVVVGSGGVGKTTLAASLGILSAQAGHDTLVMTFDPSLRLKDALGVGEAAREGVVEVDIDTPGVLHASLLDARATFDRLIEQYAGDEAARRRILDNRYYNHLAGNLGGILEYMAVERLYEVAQEGRYDRVILDTPPTHQAIDFLEAPRRIVDFLDSGALKIALKPWFNEDGRLETSSRLSNFFGRSLEQYLDRLVGMQLLRDMSAFFIAFGPMFDGFRERAEATERLLVDPKTLFLLVTGPGEARIPDTLFFARRLTEAGHRLGPIVVNRVHPELTGSDTPTADDSHTEDPTADDSHTEDAGQQLFHWLGERHRRGLGQLRDLVGPQQPVVPLPLVPDEPTDLESLAAVGERFRAAFG